MTNAHVHMSCEDCWRSKKAEAPGDWVFADIRDWDYFFLYELLKQRDETINISHKQMPSYEDHIRFIESKPYPFHKMIIDMESQIGVCYVTAQNEVGMFIDEKFKRMGYGKTVLQRIIKLFPNKRLLANINPINFVSQKLFRDAGFRLIQQTYALEPIDVAPDPVLNSSWDPLLHGPAQ